MAEEQKQDEKLTLEDKLYRTRYEPDPGHPHVDMKSKDGKTPEQNKALLKICPAEVYKEDPNDPENINVSHENCLECGTCRQVAEKNSLEWKHPDGGMGVKYRHG